MRWLSELFIRSTAQKFTDTIAKPPYIKAIAWIVITDLACFNYIPYNRKVLRAPIFEGFEVILLPSNFYSRMPVANKNMALNKKRSGYYYYYYFTEQTVN